MTMNATGTILRKRGKFIDLDDGRSYGAYFDTAIADCNDGDKVQFAYLDKEKGGRVYHNIQGVVEVLTKGVGTVTASSGGGSSYSQQPDSNLPGAIHIDRQRAIIRQSSVSSAANLIPRLPLDDISKEDMFELVMYFAEKFESYASGDLEAEVAKKMLLEKDDLPEELAEKMAAISASQA